MNDPWIPTYSGRQFFITRATPDDIYIEDIAHGLSNICRYTGQCKAFYSVAEHAVRMCELAPASIKLEVLLHDSPEAYLNDVTTMVKRMLPEYEKMEEHLLHVIFSKYGLTWSPAIKTLDVNLRIPEVVSLFPVGDGSILRLFDEGRIRLGLKEFRYGYIKPWPPKKAERKFLKMFKRLYRGKPEVKHEDF